MDGNDNGNHNGSRPRDGWDAFDWDSWGVSADGADGAARRSEIAGEDDDDTAEEPTSGEGRWVSEGGVLKWELPGDLEEDEDALDPRKEANSTWASDDFRPPPGAAERARVRAVRAWLWRQRQLANDAQGMILLERRHLRMADDVEGEADGLPPERADDPLEIELAEHQAAAQEFETALEQLTALMSTSASGRVLVEFYYWLDDEVAALAQAPEAVQGYAPQYRDLAPSGPRLRRAVTPRSEAEWYGRAQAVAATRLRVETVSAPDPED